MALDYAACIYDRQSARIRHDIARKALNYSAINDEGWNGTPSPLHS
jgi:hypothetical protein